MNEFPSAKAFQATDRVWLCLTTLYHRRFIEDAIHLVGLPAGSPLRLRYDRRYVDQGVWDAAQDVDVRDTYVVVALAATDAMGTNRIEPLRRARLTQARREGSLLVIDIALDDFVYTVYDTGAFMEELRVLAKDIPTTFRAKGVGTFVQHLPQAPQALVAGAGVGAWERAVDAFFRIEAMARGAEVTTPWVPFLFYLAGFPRGVENRLRKSHQLDVEAATSVQFDVHTIVPPTAGAIRNPLGEIVCELAHASASFVSSRRTRVDSRRDVRRIEFRTTTLFRRHYGHLSIRTIYFQYEKATEDAATPEKAIAPAGIIGADDRTEVVAARYDFPLAVGRWLPWIASLMTAGGALLAAYKLPEDSPFEPWRLVSVFALAITGTFLGLRKESKSE